MPNRNGLYLLSGRTAGRQERKTDVPFEFRRDRTRSPDQKHPSAAEQALISELRNQVRILLVDIANENLGAALLDLCELRRMLAEIGPEQQVDLDLD